MLRGTLADIVPIDCRPTATGSTRAVPRARSCVPPQQLGHVCDRPVRAQGAPLRVRFGGRDLVHSSMIPRPTTRKRTFYSGPERPLRGVAAEYWKRTQPSGESGPEASHNAVYPANHDARVGLTLLESWS